MCAAVPGQCEKPTVSNVCLESMTVNWEEPEYDGGSPVTGYFIEKKETTSKRWARVNREPIRALPLGNNWDVTGLVEGSMYQFRVSAANAAGCGLPSVPSDPVLCRDPISKSFVKPATALSPGLVLTSFQPSRNHFSSATRCANFHELLTSMTCFHEIQSLCVLFP